MTRRIGTTILVTTLLVPAAASGQNAMPPAQTMDETVRPGDRVWVGGQGADKDRKGVVLTVSPTALELAIGKSTTTLSVNEIRWIQREYHDPLSNGIKRGLLIGLGGGAAIGIAVAWNDCGRGSFSISCSAGGFLVFGAMYGAVGSGVGTAAGAVFDALINSRRQVWRAPNAGGTFVVAPIAAAGRAGARVTMRW